MWRRERFRERVRECRQTVVCRRINGRVWVHTLLRTRAVFADAYVNMDHADASANARRRVRERVCKLTLSFHGGRVCYLALSCGHL